MSGIIPEMAKSMKVVNDCEEHMQHCSLCHERLEYTEEVTAECTICRKAFKTNAVCKNKHYICDECHMKLAVDEVKKMCMFSERKNPIEFGDYLMKNNHIYEFGAEHHILVGAALLTCYRNAGGDIDLEKAVDEMIKRGSQVPNAACAFWGCCGSAISAGIFASIVTACNPLSAKAWATSQEVTARCLNKIAEVGGARCCKRTSYISMIEAVDFINNLKGIKMECSDPVVCNFYEENPECSMGLCPFFHPEKIPEKMQEKVFLSKLSKKPVY